MSNENINKEKFSECCISGYSELYTKNKNGEFEKTELYICAKCRNVCNLVELLVEEL